MISYIIALFILLLLLCISDSNVTEAFVEQSEKPTSDNRQNSHFLQHSIKESSNPLRESSIKESSNPLRESSIKESSNPLRESSIKESSNPLRESSIKESSNPLRKSSIKESSNPLRESSIKESSNPLRKSSIKERNNTFDVLQEHDKLQQANAELNLINHNMNLRNMTLDDHQRIKQLANENRELKKKLSLLTVQSESSLNDTHESLLKSQTDKLFSLEQSLYAMKSALEMNNEFMKEIRSKLLTSDFHDLEKELQSLRNMKDKWYFASETKEQKKQKKHRNNMASRLKHQNNNTSTNEDTITYTSELSGVTTEVKVPHIIAPKMIPANSTATPVTSENYAKSVLYTVKSIDRALNCPPCPIFENTKFVDSAEVNRQVLHSIIKD